MIKSPEIAILDRNIMTCIGLKSVMRKVMPNATVRVFTDFMRFADDTSDVYFHYFVNPEIVKEHLAFFTERQRKTILLGVDLNPLPALKVFKVLDCAQPTESQMLDVFMHFLDSAHHAGKNMPHEYWEKVEKGKEDVLSAREKEVLVLLAKGCTNQQVAEKLGICYNTVLTHHKHILAKLELKGTANLALYAAMNGYV